MTDELLIQSRKTILAFLDGLHVPYEYHEHERAHTIDDCLRMPFITEDVTICKNILVSNRQQTEYTLLLLRPLTPFRTALVSKELGVSRLSFAPEEALEELLHLKSGSVSPLGLIFDQAHRIRLACEDGIRHTQRIAFHPCDNAATVIFTQQDFWQTVLPPIGVTPTWLYHIVPEKKDEIC